MIFSGIVSGGKPLLSPKETHQLNAFLRTKEGKTVWFFIDDKRPPRTLSQNAYYFGVVLEYISNETGDDVESVHVDMKEMFCKRFFDENGIELERSTTRLTTKEFAAYVDRIVVFAATDLNVTIPPPSV